MSVRLEAWKEKTTDNEGVSIFCLLAEASTSRTPDMSFPSGFRLENYNRCIPVFARFKVPYETEAKRLKSSISQSLKFKINCET